MSADTNVLPPAPTPPEAPPPAAAVVGNIIGWLDGKKSYIIGIAIILAVIAQATGLLTSDQARTILEALGGTGIITLRAALAKQG